MNTLEQIQENLVNGNANKVVELTNQALSEGATAAMILDDAMIVGMKVIGDRFKAGQAFIPEMLIAARAMTAGLNILEPLLADSGVKAKGTIFVGTVQGDLHDIGKNLAAIMFKGAGYKVVDMGVNVSSAQFIEKTKEIEPDFIGISALLTTTMVNMEGIIKDLKAAGVKAKVIIGGAPVTAEYAKSIGADLYAASAADGVEAVAATQ
jgi:5-methyltetrahydrofolate--homocysteine methyltransferase